MASPGNVTEPVGWLAFAVGSLDTVIKHPSFGPLMAAAGAAMVGARVYGVPLLNAYLETRRSNRLKDRAAELESLKAEEEFHRASLTAQVASLRERLAAETASRAVAERRMATMEAAFDEFIQELQVARADRNTLAARVRELEAHTCPFGGAQAGTCRAAGKPTDSGERPAVPGALGDSDLEPAE